MCRYAFHTYRDHFACFRCRKAFKQWQWESGRETYWKTGSRLRYAPRVFTCPECSDTMVNMGLDFRAPKKDEREAWQILEALYAQGYTFGNCGCGSGYSPPDRLRDVPKWLAARQRGSVGNMLLNRFRAKAGRGPNSGRVGLIARTIHQPRGFGVRRVIAAIALSAHLALLIHLTLFRFGHDGANSNLFPFLTIRHDIRAGGTSSGSTSWATSACSPRSASCCPRFWDVGR